MAVLRGIQEKVHLPLYDSVFVRPRQQLREVESSSVLKFFVNVQRKNKLETNMHTGSVLTHWNILDTLALRVVISDVPAVFPGGSVGCINDAAAREDGHSRAIQQLLDEERRLSSEDLFDKALAAARTLEAIAQEAAAAIPDDDVESCLDPARTLPNEETMREILDLAEEV